MNKERIRKDIIECTLATSGFGFFAGVNILANSNTFDPMIPLVLTGWGATAGFALGLGVALINEIMDGIHNHFNPEPEPVHGMKTD